ncbi:MAG TPA: hypothetical protein GX696_06690, partial [Pseudomonadaceae bacterium]|nr:hypothetical protein [Pseudomonadaceae bacterium]
MSVPSYFKNATLKCLLALLGLQLLVACSENQPLSDNTADTSLSDAA